MPCLISIENFSTILVLNSKLRPQSRYPKIEWNLVKQVVMSSFWSKNRLYWYLFFKVKTSHITCKVNDRLLKWMTNLKCSLNIVVNWLRVSFRDLYENIILTRDTSLEHLLSFRHTVTTICNRNFYLLLLIQPIAKQLLTFKITLWFWVRIFYLIKYADLR